MIGEVAAAAVVDVYPRSHEKDEEEEDLNESNGSKGILGI